MALPQQPSFSHGQYHLLSGRTLTAIRFTNLFILIVILTFVCSTCASNDAQQFHRATNKSAKVTSIRSTFDARTLALSSENSADDDSRTNDNENYHYDDESTAGEAETSEDDESTVTTETPVENVSGNDVVIEPSATSPESSSSKREIVVPVAAVDIETLNDSEEEEVVTEVVGDEVEDEDDFCTHNYVDSAYFNGYDTILTRGDRLWYYYKEQHKISKAFDQRRFTQGECQLWLFCVKNCFADKVVKNQL